MSQSGRRLVVLTHDAQTFGKDYFLSRIAQDYWVPAGHDVVVQRGLKDPFEGDLAVLHIDVTTIPKAYLALARRYPAQINVSTPSIAKTMVSQALIELTSTYDGQVIVKTNANHMGRKDLEVYRAEVKSSWNPVTHLVWRLRRDLLWRSRRTLDGDYLVYENKSAVPTWVWADKHYVVEAFRPNFDGTYYYLYNWMFLGEAEICIRTASREPVIRRYGDHDLPREKCAVPENLRAWRRKLGLQFGKIDFLMHESQAVAIDVAFTPTAGTRVDREIRDQVCEALAPGFESLFRANPASIA